MVTAIKTQVVLLFRQPFYTAWTCVFPAILYVFFRRRYNTAVGFDSQIAVAVPYISYMVFTTACAGIPMALRTVVDSGLLNSFAVTRTARIRLITGIFVARVLVIVLAAGVIISAIALIEKSFSLWLTLRLFAGIGFAVLVVGLATAPTVLITRSAHTLSALLQFSSLIGFVLAIAVMAHQFNHTVNTAIWLLDPMMWCTAILTAVTTGTAKIGSYSIAASVLLAAVSTILIAENFKGKIANR